MGPEKAQFYTLALILLKLVTVPTYLGSREPIFGPAKWVHVLVEKSVFLLDSEPGLLVLGLLHDLIAALSVVGLSRLLVVLVGLAEDELVAAQSEGVIVDGHWVQVDVGV